MNCYLDNETCVVTSRATRRYVYLLSPLGTQLMKAYVQAKAER